MASILSSNGTNNLNYTGEFTKLFGQEDANLVIDLFKEILHGSLDRYYGCYSCPDRGIVLIKAKEQWLKAGNPRNMFIRHGRSVLREWEKNHPEEIEQEELSKKRWRAKRRNTFDEIKRLGQKHHLFLIWRGLDDPEFWDIYKMTNVEHVGFISCL